MGDWLLGPSPDWGGELIGGGAGCREGLWVVVRWPQLQMGLGGTDQGSAASPDPDQVERLIWGGAGQGEGLQKVGWPSLPPIGVGGWPGVGLAGGRGCFSFSLGVFTLVWMERPLETLKSQDIKKKVHICLFL